MVKEKPSKTFRVTYMSRKRIDYAAWTSQSHAATSLRYISSSPLPKPLPHTWLRTVRSCILDRRHNKHRSWRPWRPESCCCFCCWYRACSLWWRRGPWKETGGTTTAASFWSRCRKGRWRPRGLRAAPTTPTSMPAALARDPITRRPHHSCCLLTILFSFFYDSKCIYLSNFMNIRNDGE